MTRFWENLPKNIKIIHKKCLVNNKKMPKGI